MKYFFILILIIFSFTISHSQNFEETKYGVIYKFELKNSPFPHELRKDGYNYKNKFYEAENHYKDSTVLVLTPNYCNLKDSLNYIFYFHGWYNNIDSSLSQFNLIEQFYNSKQNAIFVFPEGPKNAPDSFGGKLEEKNRFKYLIAELNSKLEKHFNKSFNVGNIILSGHSGAYRVIAYILLHGGLTNNISSVILFDGLYADIEKYSYWLNNYNGKFINIYTTNGGTKAQSENLMFCLSAWGIDYKLLEVDQFSVNDLNNHRIIFIKSELDHNEVIHTQNQFQKFLEASNKNNRYLK